MADEPRVAASVTLRSRRRITLPREVCEALGVVPGDQIALEVSKGRISARPQRRAAMEALAAIRQAFAESGITERELLEGGRQVRDELFRERYPDLAKKRGINPDNRHD